MGKSGHVARKTAATLASTGSPAFFVHPAEASHGDLGMVQPGDALLLFSNSGETTELADLVAHARRFGMPLVAVTGHAQIHPGGRGRRGAAAAPRPGSLRGDVGPHHQHDDADGVWATRWPSCC